jgi:hypothetical protein
VADPSVETALAESDLEHQSERRAYWRERAEAAEAALASFRDSSPDGREGMVTVYDVTGKYVGCMGIEAWADALAREALIEERLAAKADCDEYERRGEWERVPAEVIQRSLDADKALLASFNTPLTARPAEDEG